MRAICTFVVAVACTAAAGAASREAPPPYRVGVNTAYLPNLKQETLRRWVRGTGAAMPRVGMRMDLFQKGMLDHADAWVADASKRSGSPLAMLFNGHQAVTRPDGSKDEG